MTLSAASTRVMKLFRHMEECAENREQVQCRTGGRIAPSIGRGADGSDNWLSLRMGLAAGFIMDA